MVRYLLVGGVLLLLIAGGLAYLLLRTDPSWYARTRLDPARQAAGQRQLLDRLATLHNQVGQRHVEVRRAGGDDAAWPTFELRLAEDDVNGAVTRWTEQEPNVRAALGEFAEPSVRFVDGRVELAGRSASLDSLISLGLTVGRNASGGPTVQLGRPWAGRLPLARSLVDADAAIAKLRKSEAGRRLPEPFVTALAALLRGEVVDPPIVVVSSSFNGAELLPARVEKLTVADGELVATLRPFTAKRPTTRTASGR